MHNYIYARDSRSIENSGTMQYRGVTHAQYMYVQCYARGLSCHHLPYKRKFYGNLNLAICTTTAKLKIHQYFPYACKILYVYDGTILHRQIMF